MRWMSDDRERAIYKIPSTSNSLRSRQRTHSPRTRIPISVHSFQLLTRQHHSMIKGIRKTAMSPPKHHRADNKFTENREIAR